MINTLALAGWLLALPSPDDGPVVPGTPHLQDRDAGRLLLGELGCTACHASDGIDRKQPPLLGRVGARVTPQYLRAFLSDPQGVKPGTTMPHLLRGADPATVDALVHFLVSLGGPADPAGIGSSDFQIRHGGVLYHRAGCVACHAPFEPPKIVRSNEDLDPADAKIPPLKHPAVPLGDLAMKTTVDELARFLRDPLAVRPSGRMPSLKLDAADANLIAAYLLREQISKNDPGWGVGIDVEYYEGGFPKVPDFDALKPKLKTTAEDFSIAFVKRKSNFAVRWRGMIDIQEAGTYGFITKSDDGTVLRIDGKKVVDNDGMHPPQEKIGKVKLEKGRHAFELGFVQGGGGFELSVRWEGPGIKGRRPIPPGVLFRQARAMIPKGHAPFTVDPAKAARGREIFAAKGCASCHRMGKPSPEIDSTLKAPALSALKPDGGCLAGPVPAGRPDYALTDRQRTLLRGALKADAASDPVVQAMATLNCYACHEREGRGGPDAGRKRYFVTTEPVDLGEEGTHPPRLDGIGAKLTEAGLKMFLSEGLVTREHMATRMPQFGAGNVAGLPEALAKADAGRFPERKPAFSAKLVEDGRLLVGEKGLRCVTCHRWAGRKSLGVPGSDLAVVAKRLRPGWVHAWMENPLKLRPGTRMPTLWPEGKSLLPDIQGGDMRRQMDAIWAYLSVGEKAAMPAGFSPDDTMVLEPMDEPIVFRTFVNGLGAHAIAVGFPQRTHYVFDALQCRTAAAWTGDFLSGKPTWSGRAGQYTSIVTATRVDLPPPPTLAALESASTPWPKLEKRDTGGWKFRHYRLDEKGVPTFAYGNGAGVNVTERAVTEYRKETVVLTRTIEVSADKAVPDLFVRVAVGGKIEADGDAFVADGRVRYSIKGDVRPKIRDGRELLVPVTVAPDRPFRLQVEMTW